MKGLIHSKDYSKSVIYMIWSSVLNKGYIGSTRYYSQRKANHRHHYNLWKREGKSFCKAHDVMKEEDYEFKIIERIDCMSRLELETRENQIINSIDREIVNIKNNNNK